MELLIFLRTSMMSSAANDRYPGLELLNDCLAFAIEMENRIPLAPWSVCGRGGVEGSSVEDCEPRWEPGRGGRLGAPQDRTVPMQTLWTPRPQTVHL